MRLAAILVVLSCATASADPIVWLPTWKNGNGHAYVGLGKKVTWAEGKALAEQATPPEGFGPGHLVTITDKAENDFVFSIHYDSVDKTASNNRILLGFSDSALLGEWKWIDDTPGVWQDPDQFANPIQTAWTKWQTPDFYGSVVPYNPKSETTSFGLVSFSYDDPGAPGPYESVWTSTGASNTAFVMVEFEPLPVPEPSTFVLAGIAVVATVEAILLAKGKRWTTTNYRKKDLKCSKTWMLNASRRFSMLS